MRVEDFEGKDLGLRFRAWGFTVDGGGFGVFGLKFGVQALGLRVEG